MEGIYIRKTMMSIDNAIIIVIISSALVSFLRGFLQESLSLLCWGFGLYVSSNYCSFLAILFTNFNSKIIRNLIAIALLFVLVLIIESILNRCLSKLVKKLGCSSTNKVLGVLFGSIRGLCIVLLILFTLSVFTNISNNKYYQKSQLIPYLYNFINYCCNVFYEQPNFLI
ncbi:colicin V production protein [Buchnera aphidicola (Hormaphis cornu)]|nr:colicin V production protein [Buchnera aphidicola (Hormaphis cornu)]